MGFSDARLGAARGQGAREAEVRARRKAAGHRARLQARRHLRRRVRVAHALPLLDLRDASARPTPTDRKKVDDPGQRAQPHRPGDRVRLLLLPRLLRLQGGGLRDHHGQLQPGDGLDRLRHLRPALLRAPHLRGRDERRRAGEARGRGHPVRRADAAAAGAAAAPGRRARSWAPAPTRSTWPRTASASARCSTSSDIPQPESGTATSLEEAKVVAERIGYPVLVRPSYVLGGRAMAIVYDDGAPRGLRARGGARPRPSTRSWSTASWRTPSRWTWTRWATASAW